MNSNASRDFASLSQRPTSRAYAEGTIPLMDSIPTKHTNISIHFVSSDRSASRRSSVWAISDSGRGNSPWHLHRWVCGCLG